MIIIQGVIERNDKKYFWTSSRKQLRSELLLEFLVISQPSTYLRGRILDPIPWLAFLFDQSWLGRLVACPIVTMTVLLQAPRHRTGYRPRFRCEPFSIRCGFHCCFNEASRVVRNRHIRLSLRLLRHSWNGQLRALLPHADHLSLAIVILTRSHTRISLQSWILVADWWLNDFLSHVCRCHKSAGVLLHREFRDRKERFICCLVSKKSSKWQIDSTRPIARESHFCVLVELLQAD